MMSRHSAALALAGLIATTAASALAEAPDLVPGTVSGKVAFTSDYVFRGISQTMTDPAVQGGIGWVHDAGFRLGVWGTNVDFATDAQTEVDWTAGYANKINGLRYDIGVIYYTYPGAAAAFEYDFWEAAATLGYDLTDWAAIGLGYNFSPDFFGGSGQGHYLSANLAFTVPDAPLGLTLSASVGRQYVEDNVVWGAPDYTDWSLGAGIRVQGFDLALTYTDTDLDSARCFASNLCDGRAVVSVARSF